MIFLSAKMEGFVIDFSSHFTNMAESIFFTDSEALRITSSVGFERSNDSSLDFISESERVFPQQQVFVQDFLLLYPKLLLLLHNLTIFRA